MTSRPGWRGGCPVGHTRLIRDEVGVPTGTAVVTRSRIAMLAGRPGLPEPNSAEATPPHLRSQGWSLRAQETGKAAAIAERQRQTCGPA